MNRTRALAISQSPRRPPVEGPVTSSAGSWTCQAAAKPGAGRAWPLVHIPEGRDIEGARGWMRDHGFDCDKPLPSATDAHAHVCRADSAHADAGWVRWTVVLYERRGRLADVQARGP